MQDKIPNPFVKADANRELIEAIITRDEIENMKLQIDWLQEQVRCLMSGFTLLAEAENYRIKKASDKIKP